MRIWKDSATFPSTRVSSRPRCATRRPWPPRVITAAQSQRTCLIAAVAEVHDVTLLHYDRHFDLIASATGQKTEWLARRGSLG